MTREENRNFRNKYVIKSDYCEIQVLYKNDIKIGYIDIDDIELCKQYTWHFRNNRFQTSIDNKKVFIHHVIFKKPTNGNMIDHINRNPLDNRKNNLREISRSINATNAKKRIDGEQSLIRGVCYQKPNRKSPQGAYSAQWSINGKRYTKTFSINKYGDEEAKQLAMEYRLKMIKDLGI